MSVSSHRLPRRNLHSILLIQGYLSVVPVFWLIAKPDAEALIYWVSVFLTFQFIWSLWSWKRVTGSLLDPYTIFFTAAMLFNGGKAMLEVFHLEAGGIENFISNDGYLLFSFSPDTILRSLLLVSLGLGCFHLGALMAVPRKGEFNGHSPPTRTGEKALRVVGWVLLAISFVPMLVVLRERVQVALASGYFGLFQRQAATGFEATPQVLANFMIPGVLFLLAGARGKPGLLVFATGAVGIYSIIQASTGTRLWWAMFLVAYLWLWHRQIAPIPKVLLGLGAVLLLFVAFPAIRAVRNLPGAERLSLGTFISGYFSLQNPLLAILNEMGGTLMTVAHTIELIPLVRDFDWGLGYLYSLLTVFPNLFWDVHPTVARGLYAHWLTWMISPATFYAGGGYGFSFIAEAYANFGWMGAPPVLSVIGFLFARFVLWAARSDEPARLATVAAFLAFFLIYARGESAYVVRPLVWYAFLPYMMTRLFQRGARKIGAGGGSKSPVPSAYHVSPW